MQRRCGEVAAALEQLLVNASLKGSVDNCSLCLRTCSYCGIIVMERHEAAQQHSSTAPHQNSTTSTKQQTCRKTLPSRPPAAA